MICPALRMRIQLIELRARIGLLWRRFGLRPWPRASWPATCCTGEDESSGRRPYPPTRRAG